MEALINDDLSGIPLQYGAYFVLILTVLICYAVGGGWSFNMIIAAACGLVIYLCVVHTLVSYIKTLFIVWIMDPAEFKKSRPDEFEKIMDAADRYSNYPTQWA